MAKGYDRVIRLNGKVYVPYHSALIAAGPFLSTSLDSIEQYLELPPEQEFRHGIRDYYVSRGRSIDRRRLSAAKITGNSMEDRDILDKDVVIIERADFEYIESGKIVAIERLGDDAGSGAWSPKKIVIEQLRSSRLTEFGDEIDSDDPVVVLRSYNARFKPAELDTASPLSCSRDLPPVTARHRSPSVGFGRGPAPRG